MSKPTVTKPDGLEPQLVSQIPENVRGCKILTPTDLEMYLVKNIEVTVDQAQGDPTGVEEGYYCSLRGMANLDEENQRGLIRRDLSVRFFRIGSPQMPDELGSLESQWKLLKGLSGATRKISVSGTDAALHELHPNKDVASVHLLIRWRNVIIWVARSNTDTAVDQEHVTKEAVDIAKKMLARIVS